MDTSPKIVAVAEDDPDDRILLTGAFENCGHNVRVEFFTTGSSLLDFLHMHEDNIEKRPDLILMDFYIPETNAPDLIAAIKSESEFRRIPLIVLAGYCRESDLIHCYDLGANTVIAKPDTFGELSQAIKRICDYWFGVAEV
jgi:two-component system, response regulator